MKILFINHEYPPLGGGGGVVVFQLARELAQRHRVDVLTSGFKGLARNEIDDGINIYRVPVLNRKSRDTATLLSWLSFFPTSLWKGIKLIRQNKYDVINSHFAIPSGLIGVLLSKLFNIPNIVSIYGGDIYDPTTKYSPYKHFYLRKTVSYVLNQSDGIIANSKYTQKKAFEHYDVKKNIKVISLGLIKPSFERVDRKSLALPDKDFLIMARIESFIVGNSIDDALYRANIYSDAGADAILIHSKSDNPKEIFEFSNKFKNKKPLICVPTTYNKVTEKELIDNGFKMVIYANYGIRSIVKTIRDIFKTINKSGTLSSVNELIVPMSEIFRLIGVDDLNASEKKYMV